MLSSCRLISYLIAAAIFKRLKINVPMSGFVFDKIQSLHGLYVGDRLKNSLDLVTFKNCTNARNLRLCAAASGSKVRRQKFNNRLMYVELY